MTIVDDEGFIDPKLAASVVDKVGPGDEEPETDEEAFVRACGDYFRAWQRAHKESQRFKQTAPAIFLFCASKLPEDVWPAAKKVYAFKSTCPLQMSGQLFVCNENLRQVYRADVGLKDETDALEFLVTNGLTGCAAVVFLPAQDAFLIHDPGTDPDEAARVELGPGSGEPFSFEKLDDYLARFYQEQLETHECDCDIWAAAKERTLKVEAERQIQRNLYTFFKYTIGRYGAMLDQEIKTRRGRTDVRILKHFGPTDWRIAFLELKVLRNGGHQHGRDWALKGIQQLVGYRKDDEERTEVCMLCCYDARSVDADIPEVAPAALAANVVPRRYFMKTPGCGLP